MYSKNNRYTMKQRVDSALSDVKAKSTGNAYYRKGSSLNAQRKIESKYRYLWHYKESPNYVKLHLSSKPLHKSVIYNNRNLFEVARQAGFYENHDCGYSPLRQKYETIKDTFTFYRDAKKSPRLRYNLFDSYWDYK